MKQIYKLLPDGWEIVPSSSYCNKVADGTHDTPKPVSEGRNLLTSKHIKGGNLQKDDAYLISEKDYFDINRRSKVDKWDVLFSMIGTVGEIALVKEEPDFAIKNIGLFKCKNESDSRWLYYYLTSSIGKGTIETYFTGTSQQFVSLGDLRKLPIINPTPIFKQRIASILSAYDDLIEVNNQRIKLLEQTARELYKEWFVRMRFPDYKKTKFKKGIPESWEVVSVSKAFETLGGATPDTTNEEYWNGNINWYSPTDITASETFFLSKSKKQITNQGLKESSTRLFPENCLMMTSRATIGAIGINTTPACTNQGFITCIPNVNFPLEYLCFWVLANKEYFEMLSNGSTFMEISRTTFRKINILKPKNEIVNRYTKIVSPIFQQIETLQQQNTQLRQIRDRLLPRLISGKLHVKAVKEESKVVPLKPIKDQASEKENKAILYSNVEF